MSTSSSLPKSQTSPTYESIGLYCAAVCAMAIAFALLPLGADAYDMKLYFLPWMEAVRAGGLASLSGEFADYTPPYVYLMYATSWLAPALGDVAAIKLINIPFVAVLAFAVYEIVSTVRSDTARVAAAAVLLAPTILINAFAWGQADAIYTSFAALFVMYAMKRKPWLAAAMFGVALSFKLQTVFLGPLLLYLLLSRQIRLAHLSVIPLVYLVMMLPAYLAGRPVTELFGVYTGQIQSMRLLAISAPNPWLVIERLHLIDYGPGVIIGIAIAGAVGLSISFASLQLRVSPMTTLLVAALCAALMPFLLPKMHERYLYPADVFTIALAFAVPRIWTPAILFQIGSGLACLTYFGVSRGAAAGLFPVTLSIIILCTAYVQEFRSVRDMKVHGADESA